MKPLFVGFVGGSGFYISTQEGNSSGYLAGGVLKSADPDYFPSREVAIEFHEYISNPDEIAGYAEVYVHPEGYFVTVETDSYEGCAMMSTAVAKRVTESLGRAVQAAEAILAEKEAQRGGR